MKSGSQAKPYLRLACNVELAVSKLVLEGSKEDGKESINLINKAGRLNQQLIAYLKLSAQKEDEIRHTSSAAASVDQTPLSSLFP